MSVSRASVDPKKEPPMIPDNIEIALTFDDLLLVPSASEVLPNEVSLQTRLTEKISLNCPLISAAMDTVTESATAITMARVGGIASSIKIWILSSRLLKLNGLRNLNPG